MKRMTSSTVLVCLAVLLAVSPARAQKKDTGGKPFMYLGGGITFPTGDYKTYAKTGWTSTAGLGLNFGKKANAWLDVEGYYGSNNHSDVVGDKTRVYGGMGALGYMFAEGKKVRPYLTGGAGFLVHRYRSVNTTINPNTTETKFAYTGAAGLDFAVGPKTSFYVEGRWIGSSGTNIVPALLGVVINF